MRVQVENRSLIIINRIQVRKSLVCPFACVSHPDPGCDSSQLILLTLEDCCFATGKFDSAILLLSDLSQRRRPPFWSSVVLSWFIVDYIYCSRFALVDHFG